MIATTSHILAQENPPVIEVVEIFDPKAEQVLRMNLDRYLKEMEGKENERLAGDRFLQNEGV